jgi:hypothetical protein
MRQHIIYSLFQFIFFYAKADCRVRLRIHVDNERSSFCGSNACRQIDGCCGFAHPALLIAHRNSPDHSNLLLNVINKLSTARPPLLFFLITHHKSIYCSIVVTCPEMHGEILFMNFQRNQVKTQYLVAQIILCYFTDLYSGFFFV